VEDDLGAAVQAQGGQHAAGALGQADGRAVEGDAEEGHFFFFSFLSFPFRLLVVSWDGFCSFLLGGVVVFVSVVFVGSPAVLSCA
jgi:hypothetical protein